MKSPPQIAHEVHGSPHIDDCEDGVGKCFVCVGDLRRGQPVQAWLKSSYTDQNRARNIQASHVCEACCYVHSRTSPVLGRPPKDGKRFGGNMRNYSHLWERGWRSPAFGEGGEKARGYVNASKGQKPLVRAFLEREHRGDWFAAIADSGQKHVLPLTTMNGPGLSGVVLFDELTVKVPSDVSLIDTMANLLTAGATKDSIASGDYHWGVMSRCAREVQAFERANSQDRGLPWFALALWLAQRDEEAVAARQAAEKAVAADKRQTAKTSTTRRKKPNAKADRKRAEHTRDDGGGGPVGREGSAPRELISKPAETLGDVGDEGKERGTPERHRGRVGNQVAARHDGDEPAQLWFTFGD